MTDGEFATGVAAGLIAALVFGFVARQILFALGTIRAYFSPQVVKHSTDRSPAQVGAGCMQGLFAIFVWCVIMVVMLWLWLQTRG